ncbi:MAG: efflux RND transporter permease subunit [Endozoicomonas sp. (ex Botrylloides leachii)]|nr:efflux RND transporter permease subunit [Endozoicomonas sp. (ex Botrylloides leachii)]
MLLSDFSVKKPVAACVINLLLMLAGFLAFNQLPLREYPNISSPVVTVKADYTGASAEIMASKVAKVIEDELSGIEHIQTIESYSSDGRTRIRITFDTDANIEVAANDVRDAVARAQRDLPSTMVMPRVTKSDSDSDAIIVAAVSGGNMSPVKLSDYVNRTLVEPLNLINGVGSVQLFGYHDYALLVRLNPIAMASHKVTVADVENALKTENIEAPVGKISNRIRSYTLRLEPNFATVNDYKKLVIRRNRDGSLLYLSDIATIKKGAKAEENLFLVNGKPAVGLAFIKQSKANTLAVVKRIKLALKQIKPFLPKGMSITLLSDSAHYIKAAINEVYNTLGIAIILVISVVFLFLGSARAVLLPLITIPIALLAAFAVMQWCDCSINIITLLALVLATGFLVDDAIVVLESIHTHLAAGQAPIVAAYRGTRDVGMAVVATTAVLIAVFTPIIFMSDKIGLLFHQYGITLAASVAASCIVALTMGPVIASRLLKANEKPIAISLWIKQKIEWLNILYRQLLVKSLRFKSFPILVVLISLVVTVFMFFQLPRSFAPQQDQGRLYVQLQAVEGQSHAAMVRLAWKVGSLLKPLMSKNGPIQTVALNTPTGGIENNMRLIIDLKPLKERSMSVFQVASEIRKSLQSVPELTGSPVIPSGFSSHANAPVQLVIGGGSYQQIKQWVDLLRKKASANDNLQDITTDYDETTPSMLVSVNRAYASALGISIASITSALGTLLAGKDITKFTDHGEQYDVNVQAPPSDFNTVKDLTKIHLRSQSGKWVSLDALVKVTIKGQAKTLRHYNRRKSITLSANLASGYSLGEALGYLQKLVVNNLPSQATVDYKGASLDFMRTGHSMNKLLLLAMVIVYLVLAAQFESFIHPLIIIISVPLAFTGAFASMLLYHVGLNIYTELALVMLIGLATKNGILIVEFINQLRARNMAFDKAIVAGATRRMRAVLMTSITIMAGAIPMIMASGMGSESMSMIGIIIFFGILVSTLMTLFVIPGIYQLIAKKTKPANAAAVMLNEELKRLPNQWNNNK